MQQDYGIRTSRKSRLARIRAWEAEQERKRRHSRRNMAAIRQVANATATAVLTTPPARW
jgi:hypothetical protein